MFPAEEVRSKKRRVESREEKLETEETIDPEAYKEFEQRMRDGGITKSSGPWKLLFDVHRKAQTVFQRTSNQVHIFNSGFCRLIQSSKVND